MGCWCRQGMLYVPLPEGCKQVCMIIFRRMSTQAISIDENKNDSNTNCKKIFEPTCVFDPGLTPVSHLPCVLSPLFHVFFEEQSRFCSSGATRRISVSHTPMARSRTRVSSVRGLLSRLVFSHGQVVWATMTCFLSSPIIPFLDIPTGPVCDCRSCQPPATPAPCLGKNFHSSSNGVFFLVPVEQCWTEPYFLPSL